MSPLMEIMTAVRSQIRWKKTTTKNKKKTASQLIFIQGEKNQQQVRQIKDCARVT